jgi:hypothetical protein
MEAHMAKPLLLTYNLKPGTAAGLSKICGDLGIRVREVGRDEYALPIGALAGIPVARPSSAEAPASPPFDDEMLVMCHMMTNELDAFLRAMREAGMPRIDLKAVLTPINVLWNSIDLHSELAREHASMQRRRP